MSDTDRLAALLHDDFTLSGFWSCVHSTENEWAPWCDVLARRLITAGVTLAATPAPLDVVGAARAVDGCIAIVQQSLDSIRAEDDGESRSMKASIAAREHVIWLLSGYRDKIVATAHRVTLAATPAPLDAALCDCGDGYPSYGIGKRKHLPSCHYGIIADWLDQPAPTPLAPHPGENHEYDMTCRRCGEPGYLFVGFHSPGETFRWSEAQPKEAE